MKTGPVSKLDRLRQALTLAEGKLAAKIKQKPGYEGTLELDVQRAHRLLADEERRALLQFARKP